MSGKSYEYKVLCPICGFQYHNYEMRRRWDGQIVCKDDWEPRNILDFYKTRNDTHKLPFILSDNNGTDVSPALRTSTLTFSNKLTAPAVPASTVGQSNSFGRRVSVLVTGGTVSLITRDTIDQQLTTGTVILDPLQVIVLTYTVAPSWVWYG